MKNPQIALREVSEKFAQNVIDWMKDGHLSFNNLFGKNKYRFVVPFISPQFRAMKEKIEAIPGKNFKVNLAKGIATQTIQTKQGTKEREIKLGKTVEMLGDPEMKALWNRGGGGYEIIISRHPIDVLRMSDFKHIQSCHSEGGSYFQCATTEAKGIGPIAYLVKSKDIQNIDLQAEEIFSDPDRNIDGIEPLMRLRLRKYVSKDDEDVALAIPDTRVYGGSGELTKSFRQSVVDATLNMQHDVLNNFDGRPKMKDFDRLGGSYMDSNDSELWNAFFNDDEDSGTTDYKGEDDSTVADQYQDEIDAIEDRYKNKFKNPVGADATVEDSGDGVYVSVHGWCDIELDGRMLEKLPSYSDGKHTKAADYKEQDKVKKAIKEIATDLNLYTIDEIEFVSGHKEENEVYIRIRVREEGGAGGPDEFRELMSTMEEWDKHYHELVSGIYNSLHELGYAKAPYRPNNEHEFTNFEIDDSGHILTVESKPLPIGDITDTTIRKPYGHQAFGNETKGMQEFTTEMQNLWKAEADRQIKINSGPRLPGVDWGEEPIDVNFPTPQIEIQQNEGKAFLVVKFLFNSAMPHNQAYSMEQHVKYLDTRIHVLAAKAHELFDKLVISPQKVTRCKQCGRVTADNSNLCYRCASEVPDPKSNLLGRENVNFGVWFLSQTIRE